jgi:vacuolar-type H+-ATPase subunit I/STV1
MAQQAASERLAVIEDELMYEETGNPANSPTIQDALSASQAEILPDVENPRHGRNRSSCKIDGSMLGSVDVNTPSQGETKRVSAMLAHHINRLSIVDAVGDSHSSALDERRLSILQTDELLRNWTDQCDPLASIDEKSEIDRALDSVLAKYGPDEYLDIDKLSKTASPSSNNVGGQSPLEVERENRLRAIEKRLHAEKQLTSTLEEALVDLETQSNNNRVNAESWKKKAWAVEEELAGLKKEPTLERLSIQDLVEEVKKRREAEAARAQLEERMKLLTVGKDGKTKKRKGGGWLN